MGNVMWKNRISQGVNPFGAGMPLPGARNVVDTERGMAGAYRL